MVLPRTDSGLPGSGTLFAQIVFMLTWSVCLHYPLWGLVALPLAWFQLLEDSTSRVWESEASTVLDLWSQLLYHKGRAREKGQLFHSAEEQVVCMVSCLS